MMNIIFLLVPFIFSADLITGPCKNEVIIKIDSYKQLTKCLDNNYYSGSFDEKLNVDPVYENDCNSLLLKFIDNSKAVYNCRLTKPGCRYNSKKCAPVQQVTPENGGMF